MIRRLHTLIGRFRRGEPLLARWATYKRPDGVHVVPLRDLRRHDPEGCWCRPRTTPIPRADGSMGWLETHHSADGREHHEADT